jgi:hypothetical protein
MGRLRQETHIFCRQSVRSLEAINQSLEGNQRQRSPRDSLLYIQQHGQSILRQAWAEDYNSGDEDYGPRRPWENDTAGQRSIGKIYQFGPEDRMKSKRVVMTLDFRHGSPSTQRTQTLWIRRFDAFRRAIGQSTEQPFCGDDLIRFFFSILDKMDKAFANKPGPNVSTIRTASKILICYGRFQWRRRVGFEIAQQARRSRSHCTTAASGRYPIEPH